MSLTTKEIPCPACASPAGKGCVSIRSGKPLSDLHAKRRLISCIEAAEMGIERLRKPIWANPLDHLKIDIIDGRLGPWMHLYAPFNDEVNGRDPVDILWVTSSLVFPPAHAWIPYYGPLSNSDEYRAAVERYKGALA